MFDMMMFTLHDEYDFCLPDNEEINAEKINQFVNFLVCDSCSANKSLSGKAEIPMVGCDLNLGVESWIGTKEKRNKRGKITATVSENRRIITKVDKLMGEFMTLKNAPILRGKCMQILGKDFKPTKMQETRWSLKSNLVDKESVLRPVYKSVETWPAAVQQYTPTPVEELLDCCQR